jgi:hypothetical protein
MLSDAKYRVIYLYFGYEDNRESSKNIFKRSFRYYASLLRFKLIFCIKKHLLALVPLSGIYSFASFNGAKYRRLSAT